MIRNYNTSTRALILPIVLLLILLLTTCVDSPEAPERDNPFQGDPFNLTVTPADGGMLGEFNMYGCHHSPGDVTILCHLGTVLIFFGGYKSYSRQCRV